jgi:hypothetical protein
MRAVTWRGAVLGLIATGAIVSVVAVGRWYHREWATYHGYVPLPFSHEAWVKADAETRGHMLDDLLAKHRLTGLTAEEVMTLLGPADESGKNGLCYQVGYRGFNPRAPMVFSYTLFIDLNQQGRVKEVYTGD